MGGKGEQRSKVGHIDKGGLWVLCREAHVLAERRETTLDLCRIRYRAEQSAAFGSAARRGELGECVEEFR
jgi:hypothetical protein